ncbi:glutamine synthetase family protein [Actinomadura macrotermitis]|uniref:Glutamate--isopropylamine ligase n=1 Tax=Actinomadura macrotermitis TaxID=2585200 RepID=A0A7K0BNF6_9ACTN|nr:glutamine synthetase family protein [Actinomadura macrotermitis]MQY02693.1 Glutamate--isopropylamine ligase [Actinomadura macrotermitis]
MSSPFDAELEHGDLTEIEVAWPDQYGHVLGKRIPARRFLPRATGEGFPFCDAALAWNAVAEVQGDARLTNWGTGYPDVYAVPDPATFRRLPWRPGAAHVLADVVDHHRDPVRTSPRAVLRRVVDRLAALGYEARVGVELEFYVLNADGTPLQDGLHAYSLEKANELDPLLAEIGALEPFVPVEGVLTEYGPSQVEVNLAYREALGAADDAFRLRYAVKELARRNGLLATFMAKPFNGQSGSSAHLHVSLWRHGEPLFAPVDGRESDLATQAIAGVLRHLPGLTLFGAPTVNSYKRYEAESFAPTSATWGGDNRTGAVRSLVETPEASRFELRASSADANPYWAVAAVLAATVAGLEAGERPPARGAGDLYADARRLPATLGEAIAATRDDAVLAEILGKDAVHDYAVLAEAEWTAYTTEVTSWETDRYLRRA